MGIVATITEQSGNDLSDYQVRIEITDPQFFQDCADQKYIECYFQDGSLIPHYTELFDSDNNKAVIWVKVPSIPANGTVKVLIKVNPTRTEDLSDGKAVFDFFDDFEDDISEWEQYGTFNYEISNSILTYWGSTTESWSGGIGIAVSGSFIAIVKGKARQTDWWSLPIGDCPASACGGGVNATFGIYKGNWAWPTALDKTVVTNVESPQANVWYVIYYMHNSDTLEARAKVYKAGGLIHESYATLPSQLSAFKLLCGDDNYQDVDYVAIAKLVEPSPSVSVEYVQEVVAYSDYFYWGMAKMLSGAIANFMQLPISMEIYANDTLLKTIALEEISTITDTERQLVISVLKFKDDSSDSYQTDKQIVYVTDPDGNTRKLAESTYIFIKMAELPLLLGFEIQIPYEDSQMTI